MTTTGTVYDGLHDDCPVTYSHSHGPAGLLYVAQVGGRLPNGCTLLDIKLVHHDREAIVLALKPTPGDWEPYVTWVMDVATGSTFSGHYHNDLSDALSDFERRS